MFIFPPERSRANGYINDGFIDQHLFTANRTAIELLLRKWTKGFVPAFQGDRLVALAPHISPF